MSRNASIDDEDAWVDVHEEPTLRSLSMRREAVLDREPLVLIVDDNRDARDLYAEQVTAMGCRVLVAGNGLDGLRLARTAHPDLIVLDISMPGMDGCELAQHVRADPTLSATPMIAVTCFGRAWQEGARASGCNTVLEKPTNVPVFESAVRSYVFAA